MAIALVSSVSAALGTNGGTTSAIDTTGANLIVISTSHSTSTFTVSDSKGNTYIALTARSIASHFQIIYYVFNPTVGAGHTFTITGTSILSAISVYAFSGVNGSYSGLENGATGSTTPLSTGSVTPLANGSLIFTGITSGTAATVGAAPSGFTGFVTFAGSGSNRGLSSAYLIQPTVAASNPSWAWTGGSVNTAVAIAVFGETPTAAGRISQLPVEAAILSDTPVQMRVSQLPVEVGIVPNNALIQMRLSQLPIEVAILANPPAAGSSTKWRIISTSGNHGTYVSIGTIMMSATPGSENLCIGGIATSSGAAGGTVDGAFDGDPVTEWTGTPTSSAWIQYQFGSPVVVSGYSIGEGNSSFTPNSWRLESYNGSTWDTIDTVTGQNLWYADELKSFPLSTNKIRWRINVTATQASTYASFSEIALRTVASGANQATSTLQASAEGETSFNHPSYAVDGNTGTRWTSSSSVSVGTPKWWMYWFKGTTDIVEYVIRADGTNPEYAPKTWTFEYWNGTTWVVADTRTAQANWTANEVRTFTLASAVISTETTQFLVVMP